MAKDLLSLALQSAIRDAEAADDKERVKILNAKLKAAQKAYAADPTGFDSSPATAETETSAAITTADTTADIPATLEAATKPVATKTTAKKG